MAIKALLLYNKIKQEGKGEKYIQSSTTPDPRHLTREPRGQSFPSSRSQGYKEQTRQYIKDKRETNNKNDPQKKQRLGTASKNALEDLNLFKDNNLTLNFDVKQDT